MKISNLTYKQNNNINLTFKSNVTKPIFKQILLLPDKEHCANALYNNFQQKFLVNFEALKSLGIPNLHTVGNKGVRGESLSSSKNYKFLSKLKENGITTVIDLRTADYTEKFKAKCDSFGLNYVHIPIDEKVTTDREILDNMSELFRQFERGHFYVACAQGRHRTDIALALNYIFNPKSNLSIPKMYGHIKPDKFRCQDIFTRVNSLYKAMTVQDRAKLGWTEEFEKNLPVRKKLLKLFNERFCHS